MKMQTIDSGRVFEVRVKNNPNWGILPSITTPYTVLDYIGDMARGLLVWAQELCARGDNA